MIYDNDYWEAQRGQAERVMQAYEARRLYYSDFKSPELAESFANYCEEKGLTKFVETSSQYWYDLRILSCRKAYDEWQQWRAP